MILVDSSVWIDFLAVRASKHQAHLSELVRLPGMIGLPAPVVQEVLQGIADEQDFRRVEESLQRFPILQASTAVYVLAARLYRTLVRRGTVVPPGDLTIAAHSELRLYCPVLPD